MTIRRNIPQEPEGDTYQSLRIWVCQSRTVRKITLISITQELTEVAGPPYGLPSITELLRVLINLLNPMDQKHTDSTRITSLRILNTALEVSGTDFGHYASLSSIMFDHGCKYLFQLARSENPTVLYLSLRVISTLFDTLRPYLKLQQELFLAFTIDRLAPPESSASSSSKTQLQPITSPRSGSSSLSYPMSPNPSLLEEGDSELGSRTPPQRPTVTPARGETRELMLEMLSSLASPPSFMVDLWTNYDSDLNCEDLFERLTAFLTRVSGT
jgi:golgi-specific brefeldin A-resistance guanine nucleotide exchange factor 1